MELSWVVNTMRDHLPEIAFVVGTLAVGGTGVHFLSPVWRARKMRKERQEHVEVLMTEKFVSDIMDSVMAGEISHEESIHVYIQLKRCFPKLRDLYPSTEPLKELIRKRIASGLHDTVELPSVTKRKTAFDKKYLVK